MLNLDLPQKKEETPEYLISMDTEGLHIESPRIVEKLNKVSLSPSTIAGISGCPSRWVFEKYVKPEILPEDDDTPAKRGSVFHDIMEEFFRIEPPEDRTNDKLSAITKETINTKYPEFKKNNDVILWVKEAVQGYFEMGGKPKKVKIADVPSHRDPEVDEKGLEIFIKGRLGESTRDTLGFIDQVLDSSKGDEKSVIISDWKSGAKAKQYKPHTKSNDGFDEVRQQLIYTMLMEQKDVKVSSARLIYPVAGMVVNVDVDDEKLRLKVLDSIKEADETLTNSIETNTFEYVPSFLCSWCPLAKVCPEAELKTFKKARDAQAKQPDAEDLETGVLFK